MKLTGGSGLAQLVAVASAPIVTRLYSPSDYGALAIFGSVSAILITVATGRYEMAVMLPDDDDEATAVAGVGLLLSTIAAVLTAIGVGCLYLLYPPFCESALGVWVLLIPPTVLMGGWSAVFVAYATRRGEFGLIATTDVVRETIGSAASIGFGLIRFGVGGLIMGAFLKVSSANYWLGRPVFRELRSRRPTRAQLIESARRYSKFPQHTMPAGLLTTVAKSGTPVVIGSLFGAATLGVWFLARRTLAVPSALIGQAASETYYRRAVQLHDSPKLALRLFDKTVLALATVSIVPFVLLGIFGEWLFAFVFGPEWAEAGVYARIMLPWLWIRFISTPVSRTIWVYERNRLELWLQGILAAFVLLSAAIALIYGLSFTYFLIMLSALNSVGYSLVLFISRRTVKSAQEQH